MADALTHSVPPEQIESELIKIWETLANENKCRASLFNLIIFNHLSRRTDYIRSIVQKVVEKFPCRSLFITSDLTPQRSYLNTAVSILSPQDKESTTACDQIEIGVAGEEEEAKVPFLLLPHITPDLPVYLLWTEDPSISHPLFAPLCKLATRVIVDSEESNDLPSFSKAVLELHQNQREIADLNWARTETWRDLIASTIPIDLLQQTKELHITYNGRETEFFVHSKTQTIYLIAWLASRLNWNPQIHMESRSWENLGPGTLIGMNFFTEDDHVIAMERIPDLPHHVKIQTSSSIACDLPHHFILGKTATGQSLVQEICRRGTSEHYLAMLAQLSEKQPFGVS